MSFICDCHRFAIALRFSLLVGILSIPIQVQGSNPPPVSWKLGERELELQIDGKAVATYVFDDPEVSHPYFKAVKTLGGILVTRPHPPVTGVDADDHVGLHAGLWMSFGDLSGHDYWRLKQRTRFVRFLQSPQGGAGEGSFEALLEFLDDQGKPIATCTDSIAVAVVSQGWRLSWTSRFEALDESLTFGDQEEMGLGIRLVTPLAVDRKQGGRILDDAGRRNGSGIWGKTVQWCDYAGPIDQRWVGLTISAETSEVGPCYAHARDYGFLAMNPFGRRSFTGEGEASRILVTAERPITLRFAVVVHESRTEAEYDPAAADRAWRETAAEGGSGR